MFYSSISNRVSISSTGKSLAFRKSLLPAIPWFSADHLFSWYLGTYLHSKSGSYYLSSAVYIITLTYSVLPQKDSLSFTYLQSLIAFDVWSFASCCHSLLMRCISYEAKEKNKTLPYHCGQTVYYLFEISFACFTLWKQLLLPLLQSKQVNI